MTAGPSIDPTEFLHEHLAQASPDLLREMTGGLVNTLLSADADSLCRVAIPKLREGPYSPGWLLERRRRAEAATTSVVTTCYLLGDSTRRMDGWCRHWESPGSRSGELNRGATLTRKSCCDAEGVLVRDAG
jgi:transposase-like protein